MYKGIGAGLLRQSVYATGRLGIYEIMRDEASKCDLKELVLKLIPEYMGTEIEKACAGIFPLQNVFVRKVKMLKKPKFDLTKLLEIHGDSSGVDDTGSKVKTEEGKGDALGVGADKEVEAPIGA